MQLLRGLPLVAVVLCTCMAVFAEDRVENLKVQTQLLVPLHQALAEPGPHDWLSMNEEPGQTFDQYLSSNPFLPDSDHRIIYVQPMGRFNTLERKIIARTAEFIKLYYGLPVIIKSDISLSVVPDLARRRNPLQGMEQLLAPYIIEELLIPSVPQDAAAYIAFTATDLWPGEGWNYVFGLATIDERVGVWSLHRFGDPSTDDAAYRKCLLRTVKTAVHELGHMFSIIHCTAYECVMNGSNHMAEMDSRPLALCPQCLAKILYIVGVEPVTRFKNLADFCRREGFDAEADFFERSMSILGDSNH